jgi:hypothetical protein
MLPLPTPREATPPRRDCARAPAVLVAALAAVAAGCGDTASPAAPGTDPARAETTPALAMSDAATRALALDVLERFVPRAERAWRVTSDLREPRTAYYDAVGSGVTQPRGAGDIAFAYVTLLEARPDQASFGGVPRETLVDHTIQSIRHEALTHALSGAGYGRWGNGTWQAALEMSGWAFAAARLWDRLDDETRALVRRVVTGEARVLLTKPLASREWGDTGAEDNAWNSTLPALAAVMFPDDPDAPAWHEAAIRLAMNASSTAADESSDEVVDGRPVRDWMASVNLHPDLTMENHGFFNPIYQQVAHVEIGEAAIAYAAAGRPLPEALSFRTEAIWDAVLAGLATDEGDLAQPAGQDWVSKDFQHLDYLAILATRFRRADAAVLESRALALVARRQASHADGSILGQPQLGYESMLVKRLASVWWNHQLFGPSPEPTREEFAAARARAGGVREFPYADFVTARLGTAFASMSWSSARPMALVVPHAEAHPEDPIFSYYAPASLMGSASGAVGPHSCATSGDRFSCAGSIGARRFSMTAFPDGTTLLLDVGQGSTFTYSLESIPGVTGDRPIWWSGGSGLGDVPGDWLNASDRLGMIVRGGAGMRAAAVAGTNPTTLVTGSTDTGSGSRAAVLLPLVDHERTAALAPFATQLATPDGWAGLAARAADDSLRLAIARWAGPAAADVALSDERGAPVPEQDALLDGKTARFKVGLDPAASRGQLLRCFVDAGAPLRAHQDGDVAVELRNPGGEPAAATVTCVDGAGVARAATRTLAPGEEVRARVVGDELSLAGPELEPLLEARGALAALQGELLAVRPQWTPHLLALLAATRGALRAVDDAVLQARAGTPQVGRAAVEARVAWLHVELLERLAGSVRLADELREAVLRRAEAAEEALSQALDEGYRVQVTIEPLATAFPGELLPVRVHLFHRGRAPAMDGAVTVSGPAGWAAAAPVPAFRWLRSGATASAEAVLTVPADAAPGSSALLRAALHYRHGRHAHDAAAELAVVVSPVLELSATPARLPLAAGGTNRALVHVVNSLPHPVDVTVSPGPLAGVAATPAEQVLTVPAGAGADAEFTLTGTAVTSGTGALVFSATSSTGVVARAGVELHLSDDLARNAVGAPWPAPFASSNQPPYPAWLAFDGNGSTFWVSAGTAAGQGPSEATPEHVGVDLGGPARVGAVTMIPRVNYGPRSYTIETSDDGLTWSSVAEVPSAPNATVRTTFPPVTARLLRLRITDGYDRIRPPRNVQVIALEVRAP